MRTICLSRWWDVDSTHKVHAASPLGPGAIRRCPDRLVRRISAHPDLIIHIIRTARIPLLESRASPAVIMTTIVISMIGVSLPFTFIGSSLVFVPLPPLYWPAVVAIVAADSVLTHVIKTWFVRRWSM